MPHRAISARERLRARTLRREMTEAEKHIWKELRAHRFQAASFRRQVPIGAYIVDFLCLRARLVVEIDGGQHASTRAQRDQVRDAWLRAQGFIILRFWNNDIFSNLEGVLERISDIIARAPPSLTLPRKGGGDRQRRAESLS